MSAMAWFAGCVGSMPKRSTPTIFSYAPVAPNGRPSRTAERRVISNDLTAMITWPSSGASAPCSYRGDLVAAWLLPTVVFDVPDRPPQSVADDVCRLPGVDRHK